MARRVLIYRQGSLGDTLVALPCFHLIEKAFPRAERRLLTNIPINGFVAPAEALLKPGGFIHGTIEYPIETRDPKALWSLWASIRAWRPDVLVYLVDQRRRSQVLRDAAFFRLCGIRRLIGVHLRTPSTPQSNPATGLWPSITEHLADGLRELGDARIGDETSWSLRLLDSEHQTAARALAPLGTDHPFVAFSIGTKWQPNDYGDGNWSAALAEIGRRFHSLGLVMIGAGNEVERSDAIAAHWPGPTVNLCGRLSPRESAAVLQRSQLFLGHDSGPMHLAASVGTRCVAVFSSRNLPGVWFPRGNGHRIFYRQIACAGCGLRVCVEQAKRCISSIPHGDVAEAAVGILSQTRIGLDLKRENHGQLDVGA
ncbi:glycosyltransferase family 9 protein [Azospirillum formosense]|nr:glycosyltransferase family 9 protein [Azospirillum formosense]MBY3756421.1 glycosyltransferase family 9 protein [Azospirillum formosense]